MKRSKQSTEYYNSRIQKLFTLDPEYKSVKKRYDSLKMLLQEKYPLIREMDYINLLKDTIYLDRELRRATEGIEQEEKQILEEEYLLENGYEPNYQSDIKKLAILN